MQIYIHASGKISTRVPNNIQEYLAKLEFLSFDFNEVQTFAEVTYKKVD